MHKKIRPTLLSIGPIRRRLPTLPLSPNINTVIGVIRLDFSVRPKPGSEEVEPVRSCLYEQKKDPTDIAVNRT